ncbi:MAG: tRNA lysidine(34) synthetase TilS [Ardenticatenaceae bacterium]|nr:tRNA lysidine(34) synthetase TilS [Ardenticatenaceae bacterium]MCB9444994.1 tRNA lysidine(34) synthetase TilS [Ardenticatenaceae bacterium]
MMLQERVQIWLENEGKAARPFLPPFSKLLIAVSGGPDSLALLHTLAAIFPPKSLVVVHLNHGWRAEAAEEAEFVQDTAVSLHIPCHIEKCDVISLARAEGLSLEEAGRKARYNFFAQMARQMGAKAIAVGHHADDQAETVLMHLLRGSGLAGLRGMLPVSRLPGAEDLWLVRPLLTTSRAEIEQYCREHNLDPVTDPTNEDTTYFRNRLRHELLPHLASYNPQIAQRLQYLATVTAADYALIEQLTQEKWVAISKESGPDWLTLDKTGWQALPLSLRRSSLRQAVRQLRSDLRDVGFESIEQARLVVERGATGQQATLPGGLLLTVGYDQLTIAAGLEAVPDYLPQVIGETAVSLPTPGQVQLADDWILMAQIVENPDWNQVMRNPDPWQAFVAAERPLFIRPRQPGEKMQPLGMNGQSNKLKEIMIDRKIPARLRANWPIVAVENHPVWLVGHLIDERVRVTAVSTPIIHLQCYKMVDA